MIARPRYLTQLIEHRDVDLVKIITGIRRAGKSSLLDLFHLHLVESGVDESRIIHLNFESLSNADIKTYRELYASVGARIGKGKKTYLLFDELQMVVNWEKAIESFRLDYDVDIYITGSNSYMLSSEFSTLLSGRYVEIRLLPLSFVEFLDFYSFAGNVSVEEKFQKYLRFGGMPVLREYNFNEARCNQALEGIYSTIVLRDIVERNKLVDGNLLKRLVKFLSSNIGSVTSPNSIANVLSVASKTVERHLELLANTYFFFPVERYDVKGKQLLKTLGKNYICDIGFRNLLLGARDTDTGHLLENIVYLELLRRDYRVSIGKVGHTEVDFVAEKQDEKIYVQVTLSLLSEDVRARELRPLLAIDDNYEKIVLSLDRLFISSQDGIKMVNLIDWLLA